MFNNRKIIAIVPARAGSKGLPGKNLLKLNGKSLVAWPIEAAIKSGICDKIVCSTDSNDIAEIAQKYGAEVPFIRPEFLATDSATTSDVILHALDFYEKLNEKFDYVLLLEPTSPTTDQSDIVDAFTSLLGNEENFESLVSVTQNIAGHPQFTFSMNAKTRRLEGNNINQWSARRRQDISELFHLDGSLYISKISSFKYNKSFITEKTFGLLMPKWKSFEIDDELDLLIVGAILSQRKIHAK